MLNYIEGLAVLYQGKARWTVCAVSKHVGHRMESADVGNTLEERTV